MTKMEVIVGILITVLLYLIFGFTAMGFAIGWFAVGLLGSK